MPNSPSFLGISSELQNSWLSQEIEGSYHDLVEDVCKSGMKSCNSVLQFSKKDVDLQGLCIQHRTMDMKICRSH